MDPKQFFVQVIKESETKAVKRTWRYLTEITEKKKFQSEVIQLRKKYKIPPEGIPTKDIGLAIWDDNNFDTQDLLFEDIEKLQKKFSLDSLDFTEILYQHIVYNETPSSPFKSCSLCEINYDAEKEFTDIESYPISIRISPYASQNDIVDYIQKLYSTSIAPLQDEHIKPEVRIKQLRTRPMRERDNFIYENRDMEMRELKSKIKERYGCGLVYDEINKIIYKEDKRRSS